MADIHIDLNALTDGSGTATSPRNVIPSSAAIASAGNVIKFKRGMNATVGYTNAEAESSVAYRYLSGTNCRIEAYYNSDGSDDPSYPKPIITPRVTDTNALSFFRFNGAGSGFTIRDLHFDEPQVSQVITCSNAGGVLLVENIEIYDHLLRYAGAAPTLTNNSIVLGSSAVVTQATVRNCVVDGTADDNLVMSSSKGLVEYCTFKRPGQASPATIGDNMSSSIAGATLINHMIRHNDFYLEHASAKHCYLHNTATGAGGGGTSYLYDNTFHMGTNNSASAIPVSVGETDATGSIYYLYMRRNRIIGGKAMVYAVNGDIRGTIEGNLFVTDVATPSVSAAAARIANIVEFLGNTMVNINGAAGNTFLEALDQNNLGTDQATVNRNNLFVGWPIAVQRHNGSVIALEDHNAFWDCTKKVVRNGTLAEIALGTGDVTADPLLTFDYKPMTGSPLLSAGTHLGYTRDIDRKQRQNPPSIGAYDMAPMKAVA